MKLRSDSFLDRRAMPTRCAFGRHRFYPRDLEPHERFELSDNLNPHLAWAEVPEATRSFALLCVDPDAPTVATHVNVAGATVPRDLARTDFHHWVLVDLPASLREIPEGAASRGVIPGGKGPSHDLITAFGRSGINDYTGWFADDPEMKGEYFGYDGPCPPWNDELIHWYAFTLYALDVESLPVTGAFGAGDVRSAMEGHVLAEAKIEGFYFICPEARFR